MNYRPCLLVVSVAFTLSFGETSQLAAQCTDCGVSYSDGFSDCGTCSVGCEGDCYSGCVEDGDCGRRSCLRAKRACRRACRQARRGCSDCESTSTCCTSGCGEGISYGGCTSCGGGDYGDSVYGEQIIGERIIGGETIEGGTTTGRPIIIDETDAPAPVDAAHYRAHASNEGQLVGHRESASQSEPPQLNRAFEDYLMGDYHNSMYRLTEAVESGSKDPLSRYLLALCYYQIGDTETAEATLREATRLEAAQPIANWGQRMERVQGRARVWVELGRREALSNPAGV